MGWFGDAVDAVGDAISDGADAVADVVEDVANVVGDVIEDAANVVGDAVSDVVEDIGNVIEDTLSAIPGIGDFTGYIGAIISDAFDVVGASIKAVLGIVGGVISGAVKIVFGFVEFVVGLFSADLRGWGLIKDGLGDIFSSVFGGALLIIANTWSLVQHILFLESKERKLTDLELTNLKRVFRDSIGFYNVRIKEGFAGIYSLNSRPFTLGNTIYMKDFDSTNNPEILVHECVHVWQYQHIGSRYSTDAIYAQWFVEDEYDWTKEIARGKDQWIDWNKESQGQFFEDIYMAGDLFINGVKQPNPDGAFFDADGVNSIGQFIWNTVDHTDRANEAVKAVRGATSFRISSLFN